MTSVVMVEEGEEYTKITFNVKSRTLKEMKHLAIDMDTTFTDLTNQAMEEYIQKKRRGSKK
jgi:hypothetical protein